jgi:hypothetical protein
MQMQDLLMLSKIITQRFDFDWHSSIAFSASLDNSRSRTIFYVQRPRLRIYEQHFYYRTWRLANFLPSYIDLFNATGLKSRLLKLLGASSYSTTPQNNPAPGEWLAIALLTVADCGLLSYN